jgi:hypothetical protein
MDVCDFPMFRGIAFTSSDSTKMAPREGISAGSLSKSGIAAALGTGSLLAGTLKTPVVPKLNVKLRFAIVIVPEIPPSSGVKLTEQAKIVQSARHTPRHDTVIARVNFMEGSFQLTVWKQAGFGPKAAPSWNAPVENRSDGHTRKHNGFNGLLK